MAESDGTSHSADFYKILGVEPNASSRAIKRARRDQAKKWHPDKHPDDPRAAERMRLINEAYETLSDPARRKLYDAEPAHGEPEAGADAAAPAPPTARPNSVDFGTLASGAVARKRVKFFADPPVTVFRPETKSGVFWRFDQAHIASPDERTDPREVGWHELVAEFPHSASPGRHTDVYIVQINDMQLRVNLSATPRRSGASSTADHTAGHESKATAHGARSRGPKPKVRLDSSLPAAVLRSILWSLRANGWSAVGLFCSAILTAIALTGLALWITFLPEGFGGVDRTAIEAAAHYVIPGCVAAAALAWATRVLVTTVVEQPAKGRVYEGWAAAAPTVAIVSAMATAHTKYVPPETWPVIAITPAFGYMGQLLSREVGGHSKHHEVAGALRLVLVLTVLALAWLVPKWAPAGATATVSQVRAVDASLEALPGVGRCVRGDIARQPQPLLRDSLDGEVHCRLGDIRETLLAFRSRALLELFFDNRDRGQPRALEAQPDACADSDQVVRGEWENAPGDGSAGNFLCYGQGSIEWSDFRTSTYARVSDPPRGTLMSWWARHKRTLDEVPIAPAR